MIDRKVVDTNVLLVAEGDSTYSQQCRANCALILRNIQSSQIVVLDSGWEILGEYGNKLAAKKGQPGAGYQFWKWLINTKSNHSHCELVDITKHTLKGYEEFPNHDGLKEFDSSDRKFVAVAAAHQMKPEIVQAGDSKWWGWRGPLADCGIKLNLPCEAELAAKWRAKIGKHA